MKYPEKFLGARKWHSIVFPRKIFSQTLRQDTELYIDRETFPSMAFSWLIEVEFTECDFRESSLRIRTSLNLKGYLTGVNTFLPTIAPNTRRYTLIKKKVENRSTRVILYRSLPFQCNFQLWYFEISKELASILAHILFYSRPLPYFNEIFRVFFYACEAFHDLVTLAKIWGSGLSFFFDCFLSNRTPWISVKHHDSIGFKMNALV